MLIDEHKDNEDEECEKKCYDVNKEDACSAVKVNDDDKKLK